MVHKYETIKNKEEHFLHLKKKGTLLAIMQWPRKQIVQLYDLVEGDEKYR